jgi:alkylation response protein AidB-like acyl-CoA dehydrogenase
LSATNCPVPLCAPLPVAPWSPVRLQQQRRDYSSHTDAELARAFRVLAHPLRISALRAFAVRDEPLAAGDVAFMEREDIPAATMRHHLQLLAEAGLLRPVGPRSHGSPGRPALRYVLTELGTDVLPLLHTAAATARPRDRTRSV